MADWKRIRTGIDRIIAWTKGDSILNAAARVALKGIPIVGPTIAEIYEEMEIEEQNAEGTTDLLLEILAHVQQIGPTGLDEVMATLAEVRDQARTARAALETGAVRMRELQDVVEATRQDMRVMTDTLDRMEEELSGLAWGTTEFQPTSIADRVSYLVLVESLLDRSAQIFSEQTRVAHAIEETFGTDQAPPADYQGIDDVLWWGHRQGLISAVGATRRQFRELRRITDRMREVNLRTRALVRRGGAMLPEGLPSKQLDDHLSMWLAKYDYMREHQDSHMCLIFVGASPTLLPFPDDVDTAVKKELARVMTVARLDHLIV